MLAQTVSHNRSAGSLLRRGVARVRCLNFAGHGTQSPRCVRGTRSRADVSNTSQRLVQPSAFFRGDSG